MVSAEYVRCLHKDFDFQQGMSKVIKTLYAIWSHAHAPEYNQNKTFDIWLLLDAPLGGRFTLDKIRHATIKFINTKMMANTPCVVKQVCIHNKKAFKSMPCAVDLFTDI